MHETGFEGMANVAYPTPGVSTPVPPPSPWAWSGFGLLFDVSPSVTFPIIQQKPAAAGNGKTSTADFMAVSWYQAEIIANDGDGSAEPSGPIDYPYALGIMINNFGQAENQSNGALATLWIVKAIQAMSHYTYLYTTQGSDGFPITNNDPSWLGGASQQPFVTPLWSKMSLAHRQLLLNSYLSNWLSYMQTWCLGGSCSPATAQQFYTSGYADSDATTATVSQFLFLSNIYKTLPVWRHLQADPTLMANWLSWLQSLWPGGGLGR